MSCILDHVQAVARGKDLEWVDVDRMPSVVNKEERLGSRCDRLLDGLGIDVQRIGLNVGEHRSGANMLDSIDRGGEGQGSRNDLVPRPETEHHECGVETRCAGVERECPGSRE